MHSLYEKVKNKIGLFFSFKKQEVSSLGSESEKCLTHIKFERSIDLVQGAFFALILEHGRVNGNPGGDMWANRFNHGLAGFIKMVTNTNPDADSKQLLHLFNLEAFCKFSSDSLIEPHRRDPVEQFLKSLPFFCTMAAATPSGNGIELWGATPVPEKAIELFEYSAMFPRRLIDTLSVIIDTKQLPLKYDDLPESIKEQPIFGGSKEQDRLIWDVAMYKKYFQQHEACLIEEAIVAIKDKPLHVKKTRSL